MVMWIDLFVGEGVTCVCSKNATLGFTAKEIEAPYPDVPSEWADALSKATRS